MPKRIKKIVIVGGGTAGWLTAGLLAVRFNHADSDVSVTLVESPDVPIIGVGEGTWPSMRTTLQEIGVAESDFLRQCDASFKQGSKFVGWEKADDSFYYHPFSLPESYSEINLADHWQAHRDQVSFANAVGAQSLICEHGLAPKQITTPEYAFNLNYGYHLDAGKFAQFLAEHCINKLGVIHVLANVNEVVADDNNCLSELKCDSDNAVVGDFFIDCTGFHAKLIEGHYQVDKTSLKQYLFNDTALAVQVPHPKKDSGIESCTLGTAKSCGWVWDIALPTRRGIGYVHSSDFIDEDQASAELYGYLQKAGCAPNESDYAPRKISFSPNKRESFWVKNCVAIGLSAGFVEPLEASALVLVETAAKFLRDNMPAHQSGLEPIARRYNTMMHRHWADIVDFLKLHYVLTQRDNEYWTKHKAEETIPDSLSENLALWSVATPWHLDTPHIDALFPAASYQYVLYGMNHRTELDPNWLVPKQRRWADALFQKNIQRVRDLSSALPTNRELLEKVQQYGFQSI